jgi:HlyD family secretion protein
MMMSHARRLAALSAGLGALTIPGIGCGPMPEAAAAQATGQPEAPAISVRTVVLARATIRKVTREPGQIEAFEATSLHAKVAGYVKSLAADTGDRVRKGQVLAELEVPELQAELEQKRAMLALAEAGRGQAEALVAVAAAAVTSAEAKVAETAASTRRADADVALWQAEYDRSERLVRSQAVTESLRDETRNKLASALAARDEVKAQVRSSGAALLQAKAGRDKADADVVAAKAQVSVAQADLERAEAMIGFAKIVAPYDGIVTLRRVHTGHLTVPGGASDPLFEVARTDRLRISLGVPEADAPLVNAGDRAEIRLHALGNRVVEGKVARISWSLDQGTRTLRAEVDIEDPDGALRPGLYAYATIIAEERPDVLALPIAAAFQEAGKSYCVVVEGGRARRREIRAGLSDGKQVEVVSGLDGAEAVVVSNSAAIVDGRRLQVVP